MQKIWKIKGSDKRLQDILSKNLGITPLCAQLLVNRGIKTTEQAQFFLFGDIGSCHDPFLFKDMDRAVERIKKAIRDREKILIYGDYDVDGVTSVALLSYILDILGAEFESYIPNRMEDGYGMNVRAVALARDHGVGLIITADCGITSVGEIKCANDYGIDVIVTDHHEIKENEIPKAYAIVDAHQKDCGYPFKDLAGVGVAYKLARALMKGGEHLVDEYLDLVALGTVADVSPMKGENRILVKAGLKKINKTSNEGLTALVKISGIKGDVTARHIGFSLGPRINAMGRVGSANIALDLLMCRDADTARDLAARLDRENRNRQAIEKELYGEAVSMLDKKYVSGEGSVIVLARENWHPGVLGIVASRLSDAYDMPAILISLENGQGRGSGRTAMGINLFGVLNKASDLLVAHGGHEAACGLKIEENKIDDLRDRLNSVVKNLDGEENGASQELCIDMTLPFAQIGMKLVNEIELFAPYGPDNDEPVFAAKGLTVKSVPRSFDRGGFKFLATCGNLTREAITFRSRHKKPHKGSMVDLAFTPSVNRWNGIETIQLNIRDIQVHP